MTASRQISAPPSSTAKLPTELTDKIIAKFKEMGSSEMKKMTDKEITECIDDLMLQLNNISPLILKLRDDLRARTSDKTYRLLDVGCGDYWQVNLVVHCLSELYNKKIFYVGIDIEEEAII